MTASVCTAQTVHYPEAPEKWGPPKKITEVSDPQQVFGSACVTGDDRTMYLLIGDTISVSYRRDSLWSAPRALGLPINDPDYLTQNPSVTADGKTLYFRRFVGMWRLFESHWIDSSASWTPPADLGDTVNFLGGSFAMTPDRRHLFFHYASLPWECTWNDSVHEWRQRQWVDYWKTLNVIYGLCVSSNMRKLYYDSFNNLQFSLFVHYYDTLAQSWGDPMLLNLNTMLDTSANERAWLQIFPWISADMHHLYFVSTHDGTVSLWMSQMIVDENGDTVKTGVSGSRPLPLRASLEQNYPNPFNPSTRIRYELPHSGHVSLTVYDVLGERVATLVDGDVQAGVQEVPFHPVGLSSGVYFYRLQAPGFTQTRKLLLLR